MGGKFLLLLFIAGGLCFPSAQAGRLDDPKVLASLNAHSYLTLVGKAFELIRTEKLPPHKDSYIFDNYSKANIAAITRDAPLFPHRARVFFRTGGILPNSDGSITLKMYEVNGRVAKALPPVEKDGWVVSTIVMRDSSLIARIECEADRAVTAREMAAMISPEIQLVKPAR